MSDVRPSGEVDGAARLIASARARLAAAAADLAVPGALRLTEWQRAAVASLFAALARDAEDELRQALLERLPGLPDALRAALGSATLEIALPTLEAGPLIGDPQLLGLLMRRVEEHRLGGAGADHGLLAALAGDEDAAVAAEAMGLLIAQNGRFDSFHEPVVGRSDLPAELRHRLLWTVGAGLRRYMIRHHAVDPAVADAGVAAAVALLLPGYDEADGVDARAMRLAGLLLGAGRLDPALVARIGEDMNLPLLLAALAVRSDLAFEAVWELFSDPAGAPLLLRAARLERQAAAGILFRCAASDAAAAAGLDRFDTLAEAEAARLLAPWRADPAYRAAIAELAA